jgi:acyl dehydratase
MVWSLFLHGEQVIRLTRPIAPEGKLVQVGEVVHIFDKGKGALYDILIRGETEEGLPVYEARWGIFYVGAGGFGGDPGPKAERMDPPADVAPEFTVSQRVTENQAAIYRLSGDLNPLHLDPEAARVGGFDRPILHGLCTYGYATRAIVNEALGGDVTRLLSFRARFSSVVYPGDTLTTEGWKDGNRYMIQSKTDRGVALNQALAEISP